MWAALDAPGAVAMPPCPFIGSCAVAGPTAIRANDSAATNAASLRNTSATSLTSLLMSPVNAGMAGLRAAYDRTLRSNATQAVRMGIRGISEAGTDWTLRTGFWRSPSRKVPGGRDRGAESTDAPIRRHLREGADEAPWSGR